MFGSQQSSPSDLNFALGRTRITVNIGFWFMAAIFGWPWINAGIEYVLIWVVCVFLSILLHEFGHVWAGHLFGSDGDILLHSFGGLAIGSNNLAHRWQRVIVSLAGPGVQLVLFGFMWCVRVYLVKENILNWPKHLVLTWLMMEMINCYWPLLNLLPVWPLDGGMVSREFCEWLSPREGTRLSLQISMGAAAIIAVNALLAQNKQAHIPYLPSGGFYTVLLFAMLAVESFQLLRIHRNPWDDTRQPWER